MFINTDGGSSKPACVFVPEQLCSKSRGSSVRIVTGSGPDDRALIPGTLWDFSLWFRSFVVSVRPIYPLRLILHSLFYQVYTKNVLYALQTLLDVAVSKT